MTLQDASDIAQVISAVAVFVSLAYVAYEVRQGARELRVGTQQAQTDAQVDYMVQCALSPEFEPLLAAALTGAPLTPVQEVRMNFLLTSIFLQFQMSFEGRNVGANSPAWWASQRKAMGAWLDAPAVRDWWRRQGMLFSDGFQAFVEREVAAREPQPSAAPEHQAVPA